MFECPQENGGVTIRVLEGGTRFVSFTERAAKGLPEGAVLALGCFDGLHEGHRSLIKNAATLARGRGASLGVWSPKGAKSAGLLLPPADKMALLQALGVDFYLEEDFLAIKDLSGRTFFEDYLVLKYKVGALACGENFTFGKGGKEGAAQLRGYADEKGMPLLVEALKKRGEVPYSSALVRKALADGSPEEAQALLGAPYGFSATVIKGRQVGRGLGFPTANLELPPDSPLRLGVYGVFVTVEGKKYPALANVGVHPTFERACRPLCEAYLLEPPAEALYGKRVYISFLRFFREERRFSSPEDLKMQIGQDLEAVRSYFGLSSV